MHVNFGFTCPTYNPKPISGVASECAGCSVLGSASLPPVNAGRHLVIEPLTREAGSQEAILLRLPYNL
ncbi:hypothetical protein E2C01_091817 [Portunus trituberculatus]|uniref:Uncharacterized protein n=1 Tax=Portunus trituberculatus TaxID=210409 RepID=A0A5B7JQ41_PORTR|nr:hypothetical protein [Portunus trituberculatus]